MNDIEISKALALAIGWREDQISITKISSDGGVTWQDCCVSIRPSGCKYGRPFWYTDWSIIGPIAERYDAFPMKSIVIQGAWFAQIGSRFTTSGINHGDTPQKAIALAVIEGLKK